MNRIATSNIVKRFTNFPLPSFLFVSFLFCYKKVAISQIIMAREEKAYGVRNGRTKISN